MPPPSTRASATRSVCCSVPSRNRRLPFPRTIGDASSTYSSTRPSSMSDCTSVGLPQTSTFWSAFSARMRSMTSASRIVELFQSARSSDRDTTYLGIELNLSEYGSPERDGHAAAKPSYVTRPSSIAWASSSTSRLSSPVSSLWKSNDHSCGSSTTLSSVMKLVTVSLPMTVLLVVGRAFTSATNGRQRISTRRAQLARCRSAREELQRRGRGEAVHEVRAEVVGQRLAVVLPDRLVEPHGREDDVAAGPDRRAERRPVPDPPRRQRSRDDAVLHSGEDPVAPVRDVVDQRRPRGRELALEQALDEALADVGRGGRVVPARHPGRQLPRTEAALAPAAAVAGVQERVHGRRPDRARERAANGRADRRQRRHHAPPSAGIAEGWPSHGMGSI